MSKNRENTEEKWLTFCVHISNNLCCLGKVCLRKLLTSCTWRHCFFIHFIYMCWVSSTISCNSEMFFLPFMDSNHIMEGNNWDSVCFCFSQSRACQADMISEHERIRMLFFHQLHPYGLVTQWLNMYPYFQLSCDVMKIIQHDDSGPRLRNKTAQVLILTLQCNNWILAIY